MKIQINKSIANGVVNAQPSKSYAHRLLIASCLSNNESIIENVVLSNDILATINCIKALGKEVIIEGNENKTLIIKKDKNFDLNSKEYSEFLVKNQYWIDNYALFMALKKYHNGSGWSHWKDEYKFKNKIW